jgi:hypothetical protein
MDNTLIKPLWLMPEPEIVRELFKQRDNFGSFFHFMIAPSRNSIPKPSHHIGLTCIPREAFGLSQGEKPGDIDVLSVPVDGDTIFRRQRLR